MKYGNNSGRRSVITGTPISIISGIRPPVAPLATNTPSNGLRTVGSVGLADRNWAVVCCI
jgi:hypothetical protein